MQIWQVVYERFVSAGILQPTTYEIEKLSNNFISDFILSGVLDYEVVAEFMFSEFGIDSYSISEDSISIDIVSRFPHVLAERYKIIPLCRSGEDIILAMENPFDYTARSDVALELNSKVRAAFAHPEQIRYFINKFYSKDQLDSIISKFDQSILKPDNDTLSDRNEEVQNSPAVRLLDMLVDSALMQNSSDIHIEPNDTNIRIRFRIDGRLIVYQHVDIELLTPLINRLKVISKLDISENRRPQDGHIKKGIYDKNVDFRVSIIPTIFGEKAVIRLIYNKYSSFDKYSLGFFEEDMQVISQMFNNTYGALLVTGPTGSGKTTTLAAFINELNKEDVHVVTIEDPVENVVNGVTQININPKIDLNFADVLRSILRQDPDIIMLGEIRDTQTAEIAIRAAMTGHLVLSTIHTNDAISTITRLTDMGVPEYLVAATVKGIISQRLMRKLCSSCKKPFYAGTYEANILRVAEETLLYTNKGCSNCNYTGFKGRFAVYEYIVVDDEVQDLISNKRSTREIRNHLLQKGMVTLWDNACKNVLLGNSTIQELYRAVYERLL